MLSLQQTLESRSYGCKTIKSYYKHKRGEMNHFTEVVKNRWQLFLLSIYQPLFDSFKKHGHYNRIIKGISFFHQEQNHNIGPYCAYPSKHYRFNSNKVIFASRQFSTISSSKLNIFQSSKNHWLSITKLSFFILIPTLLYDGWLDTEPSQILNYPFKPKTW